MMNSTPTNGLIHAFALDGKGGGRFLSWDEMKAWTPAAGRLWLHFDYTHEEAIKWIRDAGGLDPLVADALLTEETRPRTTRVGEGLLIALRGVNLNPGSDPDDMVSVRLWADKDRVISTRRRDLLSIGDLLDQLKEGRGPGDIAGLVVDLADRLVRRMSDTIEAFEDRIAELEDGALTGFKASLRLDLATLRRQTIALRRYLSPEREALAHLVLENVSWISDGHRMKLREVSDRLMRHIEDIDEVRERSAVTHEELLSRVSEQLNRRMYVLSVVAAIFLPLGFLTGLLGINVGGIPGAENPHAFVIFIASLIGVVGCQILLFKWNKWL